MFRDPQVNFYVRDAEASARFYRELFGFIETFRAAEDGRAIHIELRLGGLVLGVATIESTRRIHDLPAEGGGPPRAEVALWTDGDVDAVYAELVAKGAKALTPPHDFLDGRLRAAWVADPDGNPIQIVQRRG